MRLGGGLPGRSFSGTGSGRREGVGSKELSYIMHESVKPGKTKFLPRFAKPNKH